MSFSRNWSILLAIGLFHLCPPCLPCGISTHIEIAHRALEFFHLESGRVNYRELLLKHQDAYQAGSVYPDSFYPQFCKLGKYHDVSEDTHWAPFLNASVHYIRKNFPLPWEQETEKLVAFLFGISSHLVADVSWHGLGIEQGFLRTMGAIDFHGSYIDAHRAGDFGGDVLSQFEFNFNYLSRDWYVPVRDLIGIYKELYGRERVITEDVIVDCTYLQFLELFGETLAVSKLYPTIARKSPFLVDQFQEYFLGGMDDMAFWSNNIFHLMGRMLENGTRDCTVPENPLFIACGGKPGGSLGEKMSQHQLHKNTTVLFSTNIEKNISLTERGAYFSVDTWAPKMKTVFSSAGEESPNHVSSPIASYFVGVPYARLGWALTSADLNEDGHDDLVVGAPGYSRPGSVQLGRVYVVYANGLGLPPVDMDLDEEAHSILEGSQPSGRFGSAVAVMDWNRDGVPDLAVGAPSVGSDRLNYTGAVYVYFGIRGKGLSPHPDVTISCQETYCNFGWTLLAADVDGDEVVDLVVGSPYAPRGGRQRGLVAAFYSRSSRSSTGELSVEEADWMVQGEEDYSWFGYSLHGHPLEKQTLLLVGSPSWKNMSGLGSQFFNREEKQSAGKVNGYLPPSRQSRFVIPGDKAMGKLGSSLSSGQLAVDGTPTQVLLVGSSTRDALSKVWPVAMGLAQGGSARLYGLSAGDQREPALLSTFSGDRRFSRFGEALHLSDLDGDGLDEVIVAAPSRTEDFTWGLFGGATGRVYIYNGRRVGSGDVTAECRSWMAPCPEEKAQYVLISPEENSRFGSSVATVRSKEKTQVVVTAGRSSMGARVSGVLHVYNLGTP
ncbi:phosphatidylinositol-glycan-specific phospholipase D isoform X2 [Tachyglossus aculeatus]|uniref:phosphatidylinositol-glycan-specific phospholipase D isoform X2 n=1 Tax=Tachyglossus aculeatus TaxID=9261 RepID=UPI0018F7877F|nr:phosphatidylinositol-glycan-specific phospholipase D isoform X2 [Tachyglossus aculeatus]